MQVGEDDEGDVGRARARARAAGRRRPRPPRPCSAAPRTGRGCRAGPGRPRGGGRCRSGCCPRSGGGPGRPGPGRDSQRLGGEPTPTARRRAIRPAPAAVEEGGRPQRFAACAAARRSRAAPSVPPGERLLERDRLRVHLHGSQRNPATRRVGGILSDGSRVARPRICSARHGRGRARASSRPDCSTGRSAWSPARAPAWARRPRSSWRRLGATVIGCGRRSEPLRGAWSTRSRARGGKAEFEALDIRDDEAVDGFMDGVVERHGRIDLLVNNAGGQFLSPAEAITPEGLPDRDRAQRPGDLADDPRRGDQGVHPAERPGRWSASPSRRTWDCPGWCTPAPRGRRWRT